MKKPAVNIFLMLVVLAASIFLIKTSFALWSHKAEVKFTLNISQPQEEECCCGTYSTIIGGIRALEKFYDSIDHRMDLFKNALEARKEELDALPPGSITKEEFEKECEYYDDVWEKFDDEIMDQFKKCCLKGLDDFWKGFCNESTEEEIENAEQQVQEEYGMSLEDILSSQCSFIGFKNLKDKLDDDLKDCVKKVKKAGEEKEI